MPSLINVIPLPYRILAVVLFMVGLFGSGYWLGVHRSNVAQQSAIVKTVIRQTKAGQQETKTITKYVTINHTVHDNAVKTITQYVRDDSVCSLDADAVKLLNDNRNVPALPSFNAESDSTSSAERSYDTQATGAGNSRQ